MVMYSNEFASIFISVKIKLLVVIESWNSWEMLTTMSEKSLFLQSHFLMLETKKTYRNIINEL